MTAGHFCMAFDASFLAALALLIVGAGLLRGNVSPQIGELYAPDDHRRDVAFQIYGAVINFGAFVAPLLTGGLNAAFGWHVAFGCAGFGMLIGLVVYLAGQKALPPERPRGPAVRHAALTGREKHAIALLIVVVPVAALFWVAQSQIWNTYNLWARDHVELTFGTWTMPVPWLQSLDGLAPFLLIPPVVAFWRWQAARGREPDEFVKAGTGCFIFAAGTLLLAAAQFITDARGRSPLILVVGFHVVSNLGWVYFSPTITAMFSRLAPAKLNATLMGVSLFAVTFGSLASGRLGGLYEHLAPSQFWGLHAMSAALGGALLLVMGVWARHAGFARRA
jgi:POT family proton-dependent oligopeptide transporter